MLGVIISKKKGWLALVLAVIFHVGLLAIQISVDVPEYEKTAEIRITLFEEKKTKEKPLVKEKSIEKIEEQVNSSIEPPSPISTQTNIIVAKPPKVESEQPSAKVVVNINSDEFKKFLRNETSSFRNANPKSLGEFDKTFDVQKREPNEVSSTSKEAQTQIALTGVGMSEDKHGNRTCYAQIPNLSDNLGPPQLLSKDCTPKEKFVLDLDKPRNN